MKSPSTPFAELEAEPSAGPAVLVVEDNPINALVATEALRRFGMCGRHVASGEEALEVLQRQRFDLVLMDCQMPGLDGFETTMRWRHRESARGGGDRLPIIAVTANAASGDRERCLAAGMDDYLAKPFELLALRSLIERHLARSMGSAPN